jgi:hypothetical protein
VAFKKPTTRDAINALPKLAISNPGTTYAVISSATALRSQISNKWSIANVD